jgi:hypothetical protein
MFCWKRNPEARYKNKLFKAPGIQLSRTFSLAYSWYLGCSTAGNESKKKVQFKLFPHSRIESQVKQIGCSSSFKSKSGFFCAFS